MSTRRWLLVWGGVLGLVLSTVLAVRAGAVRIPIPDPGVLAEVRALECDGVVVELRSYDFEPASDDYWKSRGIGLPRERNFVQGTSPSVGEPFVWYIDADRDGWAEEVVEWEELVRRAQGSWCNVYRMYRAGR